MAAAYPMSGKPRVFYRYGLWEYCGFRAATIPALIELVRLYMVKPPPDPIFRGVGE